MMHGDSRVMVVVCLETASLPAPCLSTSTSPRSREEPFFMPAVRLPNQKDRLLAVFCVMSRRSGEARQQTTPVALGNEETVSQCAVLQLQPEPVVACEGCALALLQQ